MTATPRFLLRSLLPVAIAVAACATARAGKPDVTERTIRPGDNGPLRHYLVALPGAYAPGAPAVVLLQLPRDSRFVEDAAELGRPASPIKSCVWNLLPLIVPNAEVHTSMTLGHLPVVLKVIPARAEVVVICRLVYENVNTLGVLLQYDPVRVGPINNCL